MTNAREELERIIGKAIKGNLESVTMNGQRMILVDVGKLTQAILDAGFTKVEEKE